MSELTDDQLDGLFRKSAEEFNPPFDQAAWQDMKARLDVDEQTRPAGSFVWKNLLRWGLPVLLLLLLTGGGWFVYQKANSTENKTVSSTKTKPESEVIKTDTEPELAATAQGSKETHLIESPQSADEKQPDAAPVASSEQKTDAVRESAGGANLEKSAEKSESNSDRLMTRSKPTTAPEVANVATKSGSSAYSVKTGRRLAGNNRVNRSDPTVISLTGSGRKMAANRSAETLRSKTGTVIRQRRKKPAHREELAILGTTYATSRSGSLTNQRTRNQQEFTQQEASTTVENPTATILNEPTSVALPTLNGLAIRPANWPKVTFTNPPVIAQPDTVSTKVTPAVPVQKGLSVRFVVAPDLSSVGLKNFSRPGTNVGLMLEYRLASRWSVQAGVLQSTKVYRALGDEYKAPAGIWAKNPKPGGMPYSPPETIDGRCNMIDIPINLRYDIILHPQADKRLWSRWFISGGVTSYIIKDEEYKFNYTHSYYGQRTDTTTSTGGYGVSNFNLSIGYERAISRRLSWQVEPFMKMPLRGVGFFNINLLSTGAFFSLRLKL
ncbi:hypothetical protein GCM10028805_25410 [Spirosoma harenae]